MGEHLQVGLQDAHVDVGLLARGAEPPPAPALAVNLVQLHGTHLRILRHRGTGCPRFRPTATQPREVI